MRIFRHKVTLSMALLFDLYYNSEPTYFPICTTIEWARVNTRWYPVDGFDTRGLDRVARRFSCGIEWWIEWLCWSLYRSATHCNALQRTATHCNALQRTATHCNTLQHTATHCNTLQRTATHCSTLQHTVTHCNTLQHTAIHCNTLRHTATPGATSIEW